PGRALLDDADLSPRAVRGRRPPGAVVLPGLPEPGDRGRPRTLRAIAGDAVGGAHEAVQARLGPRRVRVRRPPRAVRALLRRLPAPDDLGSRVSLVRLGVRGGPARPLPGGLRAADRMTDAAGVVAQVARYDDELVRAVQELVRIPSENPPGGAAEAT